MLFAKPTTLLSLSTTWKLMAQFARSGIVCTASFLGQFIFTARFAIHSSVKSHSFYLFFSLLHYHVCHVFVRVGNEGHRIFLLQQIPILSSQSLHVMIEHWTIQLYYHQQYFLLGFSIFHYYAKNPIYSKQSI